jgi:hypothetical protein
MPVRYDIAAQVPQVSGGGFDPLNAFAQMQAMDYRQQQNALAQMQMQEYQRKMQVQNALGGVLADPGFDVMSPQAVSRLVHSGNLSEGLSVLGAQRQAAAQAATARHYDVMSGIGRRKLEEVDLPESKLRAQKLGLEVTEEERKARKALADADAATLDLGIKRVAAAQDALSQFDPATPDTWSQTYSTIKNIDPGFAGKFTADKAPTAKEIDVSMRTADMVRRIAEDRLKNEFEYREVSDAQGNTRIVGFPKKAPQTGAFTVPGAEGQKPPQYSFSPGLPGTGTMFRGDPRTGMGQLFTPGQPGMPMPANAMAPAPLLPQTSFTNAPPPAQAAPPPAQAAPPQGMVGIRGRISAEPTPTAPLGSTERGRQDVMQQVLQAGGYNPDTGVDIVEPLLSRASSGMLSAKGTDIGRMFGANSAAAQADTELKRVSADLTQAFAGNRLATAGVAAAEADRFEKQAADIGNPNLTIGERLAAYRGIKRNATRLLGSQYINPFDKSGMTQETMIRARVEETPEGEFTVPDPDGGVHRFGTRKQAAEFLSYVQRMTLGKR